MKLENFTATHIASGLLIVFGMVMLVIIAVIAQGSGDDVAGVTPAVDESVDEFYFRVHLRDHIYDARTWLAESRIYPPSGKWPGVDIQKDGTTQEANLHAILAVTGLHVPSPARDLSRWHAATERETRRFAESVEYIYKLLSLAETCIIRKPISRKGIVYGQVFVVIGGERWDIGELLIADGHASLSETDWGQP